MKQLVLPDSAAQYENGILTFFSQTAHERHQADIEFILRWHLH